MYMDDSPNSSGPYTLVVDVDGEGICLLSPEEVLEVI